MTPLFPSPLSPSHSSLPLKQVHCPRTSSSLATHILCTAMLLVRWPRSAHLRATCSLRDGQRRCEDTAGMGRGDARTVWHPMYV